MKHKKKNLILVLFMALHIAGTAIAAKSGSNSQKNQTGTDRRREALIVELTGKDIRKQKDTDVYAMLVEAHHLNDEIAFKSRLQFMLTHFKSSALADNALYMAAERAVDQKDFAGAIRYISRIEKDYSRSNKLVSAKYLKAKCYNMMNLTPQARQALIDVRTRFPGSPESFRAATDLKILNQN